MRYFILAGEPSGDQHAARLMNALIQRDQEAVFAYVGGDRMAAVCGSPVISLAETAVMGFTQVLTRLPQMIRMFATVKKAILDFRPDLIIWVDYAGFNLRMARWAARKGLRSVYYIAPKAWAWNRRRVNRLRTDVDRVFCILPFEEAFFRSYGVDAVYVGNPVADALKTVKELPEPHQTIALLPGSRRQEIKHLLPLMLDAAARQHDHRIVVAGMSLHRRLYEELIPSGSRVEIQFDQMHEVLNQATAALVTSGTATLETALMGVPQVVVYQTHPLSYLLARLLIRVRYISLVNLILKREAVPELIQQHCTVSRMASELERIMPGGPHRESQLQLRNELAGVLGAMNASDNLAALIVKYLNAGR